MIRRPFGPVVVLVGALMAATGCLPAPTAKAGWHPAWSVALALSTRTTTATHCRYTTRSAASGSQLRAEFSDSAPTRPTSSFHVSSVTVSPLTTGPAAAALPPVSLTFGSATGVTVPAHAQVLSDPVRLSLQAGQSVVVDVQVDAGDASTAVLAQEQTACSSIPGGPVTHPPVRWLSALLVDGPAVRSVEALGDSITEGLTLPAGGYQRWTDDLVATGSDIVNEGVSGGAVTGPGVYGSVDGVTRLRGLVVEPGVTDVVIELGTNDLTNGASASRILTSLDQALAIDRGHGIATAIATIAPRGAVGAPFAQERVRLAVNAALRSGWLAGRQGSLVDLDAALRDPRFPSRLLPAFDSGDHVHPNATGQRAIARAVASVLRLPSPR